MKEHWLMKDGLCLLFLGERPGYCDRGRYHAVIDNAGIWRSDGDIWPRYYFDLDRAKAELEAYLKAKKVDLSEAFWMEVGCDDNDPVFGKKGTNGDGTDAGGISAAVEGSGREEKH